MTYLFLGDNPRRSALATVTPELSKNLINGKWVEARSRQTMPSTNPATGEVLGVVPKSGPEDITAAVEAAKGVFEKWRKYPAPRRAEILFRAAEMVVKEKENLARLMTQEMGKVLTETRGDVQEAIDMTYFIAGEGRRLHGYTAPSEMPNKAAFCIRVPVGVVGVITPWNFPMAIPSWKIVPALLCGNTVVFKPATYTPLVGIRFAQVLQDAGLPPGVLNIVTGSGNAVGDALVEHPDVAIISFTGSTETGLAIAGKCARRGKRLSLEMGGKKEGARVLVGGRRADEGSLGRGSFYAPTIFDNVDPNMRIAKEEIFGPVTDLIEAKTFEDAVQIVNNVEYGLSASIFTRDVNKAMRAIDDIFTGIVYINHGTIGAEVHLPFGGTKNTGNGHREGGLQVLDVFSEWKSVYIDYSGRLQRAQIDKD